MEPAWRQQGRGRGRGQGGQGERSKPPQKEKEKPPPGPANTAGGGERGRGGGRGKTNAPAEPENSVSVQSKFEEIRKSNQAAAQRLVQSHFSSSDDDEDEDGEIESKDGKRGKILVSTFTTYTDQSGGDVSDLVRTGQFVSDLFQSGALTCLICIASVKRTQQVWSCSSCFSLFHIPCIQKWARDSVFLVSSVTDEDFGQKQHPWPCPKCRAEYPPSATPNRYMCYCGKLQDPPADPWLVPHSCGSVCQKELKPVCGHTCLLLCHPGPCPPCPKMVSVSCMCGKAKPLPRRCSNKDWSCQQRCGKMLPCKQHTCTQPCHAGQCSPCPRVSVQRCACGREESERQCASPQWHCEQVCGAVLSCGNHTCDVACHGGVCPPCPRSDSRTCPCGKTKSSLPCTEEVLPCGDTCERRLSCGKHTCSMRCHRGTCETCRQVVEKECRCGKYRKLMPCHKEYLCDSKCPKTRSCQRHQCRRKCCPGNCPPCDQSCGRTLGCRNHKCPSVCHQGSCYPCPETVEVRCVCGSTVLIVPCGRERSTKPPRCKELCRSPPSCHHPAREHHRCHPGSCPACRLPCLLPLPRCRHTCPRPCHDLVLVRSQQVQLAGPWEQPSEPAFVKKALPCPPCDVPIPTACYGEHEVSPVPCHLRGPFSCGRPCGRPLTCGNHSCSKECHGNKKQCEACEVGCVKPRPSGCPHPCSLPCHPGDCPPCRQMTRQRCHCKISLLYVECMKLTSANEQKKVELGSCNNQCPKELICGHRCKEVCHPGVCEEKCQQRVKVRCPCKRIKKEFPCTRSREQHFVVECDNACKDQQRKASQLKEAEERAAQEEEQRKLQEELEAFEKRQRGGRRSKKRGRKEEVEGEQGIGGRWRRCGVLLLLSLGGALLATAAYYLLNLP